MMKGQEECGEGCVEECGEGFGGWVGVKTHFFSPDVINTKLGTTILNVLY